MSELKRYKEDIDLHVYCKANNTYSFKCPTCDGLAILFACHPTKYYRCTECNDSGMPQMLIKKLKNRYGD